MTPLIPRNTTIPHKVTQKFSNPADNQDTFMIAVYEGERKLARDCICIGQFSLKGIPKMPRGRARIKVTFDIGNAPKHSCTISYDTMFLPLA